MGRHTTIERLFVLIVVFVVACSQWSPQVTGRAEETTIAGCLQTGGNPDEFVVVTDSWRASAPPVERR